MATLNYLTVQDILWVNLKVARKANAYNFATLEEATFYQYGYGNSKQLASQAAQFIGGFEKLRPFSIGNEATGFIATVVFLRLNGVDFIKSDEEGATWYLEAANKAEVIEQTIRTHDSEHSHGKPEVKTLVANAIAEFPKTIAKLAEKLAA